MCTAILGLFVRLCWLSVNGKTGFARQARRWIQEFGWIYRFRANPGMPRGGIVPPAPVLAPGSALGSRPRVALSSAQAPAVYRGSRPPGNVGAGSAARTTGQKALPGTAGQDQENIPGPS